MKPTNELCEGVGPSIYGDIPKLLNTAACQELIKASTLVCLHTAADRKDVDNFNVVRQINPTATTVLAIPGNYLSRMALQHGIGKATEEMRRVCAIAKACRVDMFELNGEGASSGQTEGDWTYPLKDLQEAQRLDALAAALLTVCHTDLPKETVLAWTSHDMPGFRLPWKTILNNVDVHAPQHYPAQAGFVASQRTLDQRILRSAERWSLMANRGEVPRAMIPYGSNWSHYGQGHGHSIGATAWGLTLSRIARLWAYPNSWDESGLKGLKAAVAIRKAVGYGPDAVKNYQMASGLVADGIIGPKTLSHLGVV